jgi:3-hydroxyisobutyrate dehydrogenase-like beta-hydroxyacid dehydrogenase
VEAAAGKLTTMVGASDPAFARARPILEAFCENIFHMGPVGAGTRTKLLNNLITMGQAALIAEALCACKATGVDLRRFYDVISAGGGNSGIFQMIVPEIINNGSFDGMRFSIANAMKDLGYYRNMASAANVEHPLGDEVHRILAAASTAGRPQGLVGELVAAAAQRNHLEIGKLGQ